MSTMAGKTSKERRGRRQFSDEFKAQTVRLASAIGRKHKARSQTRASGTLQTAPAIAGAEDLPADALEVTADPAGAVQRPITWLHTGG